MLENRAWDKVAGKVSEADFYRPDHRLIFVAIQELADRNEPRDAVTLSEFLERRDQLTEAGGLGYLGTLAKDTPSAANIVAYADIVRERALLRELIETGNDIAASAYRTEGRPAKDLVDDAERRVFEIAERGERQGAGFIRLRDVLENTVDRLDTLHQAKGDITGVPSGFKEFDQLTAGLQKGDLIIIAGRPSMGTTTMAMNIAENAAFGQKLRLPTAIFSMEMSTEQLAFRLIASLGQVNQSHLRNGRFSDEDWPRINGAIQQMSEAPLFIDDSGSLTPTELRARSRRLKREHGLELIVVDYLQLMQVPGTKENRATEISEISRSLKALAKELQVPIIALSQLNRSVEQRTDKKPVMSDLRESGAIEQDADVIMLLHREEYYHQGESDWAEENPDKACVAEVIIAKQRNGPTGTVKLQFSARYALFHDLAEGPDKPPGHDGGYVAPEDDIF